MWSERDEERMEFLQMFVEFLLFLRDGFANGVSGKSEKGRMTTHLIVEG